MTLVVMHRKPEEQAVQMFADSRVSAQGFPLTNAAAKLLPLPVAVYNDRGVIFRTSFAYAFAGSTLLAQSVYAFASAALQTLRIEPGGRVPNLEEVATFVATYARDYVIELGERVGSLPQCQIAIGGYCSLGREAKLFIAKPEIEDGQVVMGFGSLDITQSTSGYHLGSDAAWDAFREATEQRGKTVIEALSCVMDGGNFEGVGGSVQVMIADKRGARNVPTLHRGPTGASLQLLGKPIEAYGSVGGCNFRHEAYGLFE